MKPLYSTPIVTAYGEKRMDVYACDILDFDEPVDILTTSAYVHSYAPSRRTVFEALLQAGISVEKLALAPQIDLRHFCNVWLSHKVHSPYVRIGRIGCIEMNTYDRNRVGIVSDEQGLLHSIRSYFQMLDIAATYEIPMNTVALPLLGAGRQNISAAMTMIPILNECVSFLRRNESVQRICFIERNWERASQIAAAVQNSYLIAQTNERNALQPQKAEKKNALAFVSYASPDKNIADNLCARLERKGIKVWYAPRDVRGPYAAAISDAIGKATHFIVILSENSLRSEHVLNEIDLAFQGLPDKIKFKPLRIDESMFTSSFRYYLSRQHWMDATIPPLEDRLEEFVEELVQDLSECI